MRRELPLAICFIMGLIMAVQFFIPHRYSQWLFDNMLKWLIIVLTFAMILGIGNLIKLHIQKVQHRRRDWLYSIVALFGISASLVTGFGWGIGADSPFMVLYNYVQIPMQATMFSLLAFYIASAAFRTFRARTLEATLLLIAAVIVMLGRVPLEGIVGQWLPDLAEWILDYPNMAAKRGIMIGIGLGAISTALKIILGIERSWLGGGD
ncbi:MAG: hypothetical protein PVH29_04435 [Candidatus Zixiibacteriota bacterium]